MMKNPKKDQLIKKAIELAYGDNWYDFGRIIAAIESFSFFEIPTAAESLLKFNNLDTDLLSIRVPKSKWDAFIAGHNNGSVFASSKENKMTTFNSKIYLASAKFRKLAQATVADDLPPQIKMKNLALDLLEKLKSSNLSKEVLNAVTKLDQMLNSPQSLNPDVLWDSLSGVELDLSYTDKELYQNTEPMFKEIHDLVTSFKMSGLGNKQENSFSVERPVTPATQHSAVNNPIKATYQKIDTKVQDGLNFLGYLPHLVPDGILGPETKKGLDWFMDKFKLPPLPLKSILDQVVSEFGKAINAETKANANKVPRDVPGPKI